MSYILLYNLKPKEKGTGLMSINMEKTYKGLFCSYNMEGGNPPSENRIWQIQNPYLYDNHKYIKNQDHVFIRDGFINSCVGKKMTNGFSYLKNHRSLYKYFLPTIYQSNFGISDVPSIGYYARDCRIQSNIQFGMFTETLPSGTPVVTMGTKECIEKHISPKVEWFHTYDQDIFWKSCSHYFYYRPSDIEDPLPHTLLEAIQSKHRIISPKSKNRTFYDGIDDLLSCIEYDENFIEYNIGEYCDLLDTKNWKNFMSKISEDDFLISYPVNRPTFKQWIVETL